jgi:hypothetical protein
MDLDNFLQMSKNDVAHLVGGERGRVCVFPYNGTRRWFAIENPGIPPEDFVQTYMEETSANLIQVCELFFDHGIDTLLIPLVSPETVARGETYMTKVGGAGLERLVKQPEFRDFYRTHDVRVHFYGDYRKYLTNTSYDYLVGLMDQIAIETSGHRSFRIFYGAFAQDATDTLTEFAIQYYLENQKSPDKRTLIEMYYGEYVKPVDLFIGFGKLRVFDMPLIATGREGLYFMVSPSPYLNQEQLRRILYDFLYVRRHQPLEAYTDLPIADFNFLQSYYHNNIGQTLGVGSNERLGFWYPIPQVTLLEDGD